MSNSPLMQAVATENLELVQLLLSSHMTQGINDKYEMPEITPLMLAISKGNIDLIKSLLENGAKEAINDPLRVCTADGLPADCAVKTPLQHAIDLGNLEIVTLLLENGATDGSPVPPTTEEAAAGEASEGPAE